MHYHREFFGFFWVLIWLAFVLLFSYFNRRERMHLYDLADKAAAEGRALPPEIFGRLRRRVYTWQSDLRVGIILCAVGIGMAVAGVINYYSYPGPNPELFWGPFKMFPVPLLIGVAFLLMGWLRRRDDTPDR